MARTEGAIIEITIGQGVINRDIYEKPYAKMAEALATIKQNAFGGNLRGFVFKGTNIILEPNRIILLKDDMPPEWSDHAAAKDVSAVLQRGRGGRP
jgi:hypothetical protein